LQCLSLNADKHQVPFHTTEMSSRNSGSPQRALQRWSLKKQDVQLVHSAILFHISLNILLQGIVEKGNISYKSKQICVYANTTVTARTLQL
jgi:hypothetical protein